MGVLSGRRQYDPLLMLPISAGGSLKRQTEFVTTEIDVEQLLKSFLAGRSKLTVKAYSQDLADFRSFTGEPTLDGAARRLLSASHGQANMLALSYKTHLGERKMAPATINRRLAALRSLVHLARTFGMVTWTLEVQNVKGEPFRDTKGPGTQNLARLRLVIEDQIPSKAARESVMVRLLYDLALRCGELVSLDLADVNLNDGTIAVRGKGHHAKQILTMPEPTKLAMETWLKIRGFEPGPLFINFDRAKKGKRLTTVSVYRIIRDLGREIGIKLRPHGLRHTAITEACKLAQANGYGLEEVLDFSRHSRKSIAILMVYRDQERNIQGKLASMVAAGI